MSAPPVTVGFKFSSREHQGVRINRIDYSGPKKIQDIEVWLEQRKSCVRATDSGSPEKEQFIPATVTKVCGALYGRDFTAAEDDGFDVEVLSYDPIADQDYRMTIWGIHLTTGGDAVYFPFIATSIQYWGPTPAKRHDADPMHYEPIPPFTLPLDAVTYTERIRSSSTNVQESPSTVGGAVCWTVHWVDGPEPKTEP